MFIMASMAWPAWPLASPIFCMMEMVEAHQADVVGMVTFRLQ